MPAAKRRGVAAGRGSPVYHLLCVQGGPVRPDEKTIKAASEPTINTRLGSPREWPIWGGSGQTCGGDGTFSMGAAVHAVWDDMKYT